VTDYKETPIISSFMGFVKKGTCPVCGSPLSPDMTCPKWILCPNCGEYMTVHEKKLRQVESNFISAQHNFAAPTPWMDMWDITFPTISLATDVEDYLKDTANELLMTKKDGVRILDAKWPDGCCVCGKPATKVEAMSQRFTFVPPGIIRVKDHEATLVAKGIPHCSEHKQGAQFNRATFGTETHNTVVGLLFRSYAYQKQFRNLNPWIWPYINNKDGQLMWSGGDYLSHGYKKNAWNGSNAYHDNGQLAWSKKNATAAYYSNGVLAWNGSNAYDTNGKIIGTEGVEII
jgi:hypothetical protein